MKIMIMTPLNMRCPNCGTYGHVWSLTGLSESYIAKCTNCNFYISTDDIVSGGSAHVEPNDERCDVMTDERDRKIAELTEKLEAYERTGMKPEKFVVVDRYGNADIVEADDIHEALEQFENNHYGYQHIRCVCVAEEKSGTFD